MSAEQISGLALVFLFALCTGAAVGFAFRRDR